MSEKPLWAQTERAAISLESLADDLGFLAELLRCEERDLMGARCTQDRHTKHEHRVRTEDLP